MRVILFGASGMVGQGVLRECLLDPAVTQILTVGRRADAPSDPKLTQIVHRDFFDFTDIEPQLSGYDACFFCLGVSSGFMREQEYAHLTYDLTLAAARTLSRVNPGMTFVYVSGAGTDSSEQGLVEVAVQSRLYVAAWRNSAVARGALENCALSGDLLDNAASSTRSASTVSRANHHDRTSGPRDDRTGTEWLRQTDTRSA